MIRTAIIEDDPRIAADIAEVIRQADDVELVASAGSVATGCKLIDEGGFDVLVCDLGLPDGDGTTLIRKAAAQYPDIDILVLTMFADHHKVLDAIRAGARGYLLKDQKLGECVAAIREVRKGGSPISPIIARLLLKELSPPETVQKAVPALTNEEQLSEREKETLHLLSRGFTYSECAELMGISQHTVGTHVKHIYRKLEVNSRAEAVFEASNRGMLDIR
jgi:DNA-binding NarL/FixJ family response regulator